jgi:hypothetical protein
MLMNHPFTFSVGLGDITLTTNDLKTTLRLYQSGIAPQTCDGKFIALGIGMGQENDTISITLLTTTGDRCYQINSYRVTDEGGLERHHVSFDTDKDLSGEALVLHYDDLTKIGRVVSPEDHEKVYVQVTLDSLN